MAYWEKKQREEGSNLHPTNLIILCLDMIIPLLPKRRERNKRKKMTRTMPLYFYHTRAP